ncbi:unnamed protein product, partial [Prorocentrum cordatum]
MRAARAVLFALPIAAALGPRSRSSPQLLGAQSSQSSVRATTGLSAWGRDAASSHSQVDSDAGDNTVVGASADDEDVTRAAEDDPVIGGSVDDSEPPGGEDQGQEQTEARPWKSLREPEEDNVSRWRYQPANGIHTYTRKEPTINSERTKIKVMPGEVVSVVEERRGEQGVTFLRIANGTGWMFDSKPGVGTMCVKVEDSPAPLPQPAPEAAAREPAGGSGGGRAGPPEEQPKRPPQRAAAAEAPSQRGAAASTERREGGRGGGRALAAGGLRVDAGARRKAGE